MAELIDQGNGIFKLEGSFSIGSVGEVARKILHEIQRHDSLGLDLSGVKELDLTMLQLLCSAHRYTVEHEKELYLVKGSVSQSFKDAVEVGGFNELCECVNPDKPGCIWKD